MKIKRILSRLALLVVAMVMVFVACKKDTEEELASVSTNNVEGITQTAAVCGGNVTDDGGANVTARGICWSVSQNPTIDDNATYNGTGTGSFTSNISGLTAGTTYYVRAYAVNNQGTAYGEERTFITEKNYEMPTVKTNNVTNVTKTGAICGGNVTSDGGASIIARGVCWSTLQNPTISDGKTNDGSSSGQYTSAINGLQPNTTYYVRAYATNSQGTSYGSQKSFTTEVDIQVATVTTSSITNITGNTAVCGGNVTSDGNATVTARGVCWSTSPNPMIGHNKTTDGSGTGSFTSNITGLQPGTTYYVRAYATNSQGTSYGSQKSFTTEVDIQTPTVTTSSVTNITGNTAVCGGNVTSDGNATVTARGVCWSTSPNPMIGHNKTTDGSGTGSFTSNITGLQPGTTYYVRAYATNSQGTAYGTQQSFTTVLQHPTLTTTPVTNITINSAVCGGNIISDGGATITARGVCWSTSPNPMIGHNRTTDGSGTGSFTSNITGLQPSTTYYVRAYATNSQGTAYGTQQSFTTVLQHPTLTTTPVTNITINSAVCGGNIISDGGATITARGVCWSTSPNPTIGHNRTTDGSGTGSFISNITGLQPNTTYYVRAYATNSQGTSYGEELTFTTLSSGINGHEFVDLGLPSGLKWATCNVGATTPEDYGNYYAWGETTTKATYNLLNSVTFGQYMGDISGNATYDAARANWGSTWRMPTKAEMEELRDNCTWIWTSQNGVNGCRVTGPNGNSIFLPAAGHCDGSLREYVGGYGYYWSSTPYESTTVDAYGLSFCSAEHYVNFNGRYDGRTVRPVSE